MNDLISEGQTYKGVFTVDYKHELPVIEEALRGEIYLGKAKKDERVYLFDIGEGWLELTNN